MWGESVVEVQERDDADLDLGGDGTYGEMGKPKLHKEAECLEVGGCIREVKKGLKGEAAEDEGHLRSVVCVLDIVYGAIISFNLHKNPVNLILGSGNPSTPPQASRSNSILSPAVALRMGVLSHLC